MKGVLLLKERLVMLWRALRTASGDDAYECYLAHHTTLHAGLVPLDRATFFKAEQQRKWEGVRRCC